MAKLKFFFVNVDNLSRSAMMGNESGFLGLWCLQEWYIFRTHFIFLEVCTVNLFCDSLLISSSIHSTWNLWSAFAAQWTFLLDVASVLTLTGAETADLESSIIIRHNKSKIKCWFASDSWSAWQNNCIVLCRWHGHTRSLISSQRYQISLSFHTLHLCKEISIWHTPLGLQMFNSCHITNKPWIHRFIISSTVETSWTSCESVIPLRKFSYSTFSTALTNWESVKSSGSGSSNKCKNDMFNAVAKFGLIEDFVTAEMYSTVHALCALSSVSQIFHSSLLNHGKHFNCHPTKRPSRWVVCLSLCGKLFSCCGGIH